MRWESVRHVSKPGPENNMWYTHVNNPCHMALDRNAAQHQIDLIVTVPIALEVLDDAKTRLAIRDRGIHVVLLALLINAETLKVNHSSGTELRLDRAGNVNWRFAADHAELGLAILDDFDLDGDDARHLDGAAEGDFTVALYITVQR